MALPEELFEQIKHSFALVCIRVNDFLRWRATCRSLWHGYLTMRDEEVLEFCEKKEGAKIMRRLPYFLAYDALTLGTLRHII